MGARTTLPRRTEITDLAARTNDSLVGQQKRIWKVDRYETWNILPYG